MRAAILAMAVALAASACGVSDNRDNRDNRCHHPDQVELSCESLPATASQVGCMGQPSEDLGGPMTHVGERYPVGCVIRYPACLAFYPESTQTCACMGYSDGGPAWVCPI